MASFQLSSISGLTGSLTDVLVLLALLKLAFCIKLLHAGEALTVDQALRIVSLVFATILGIFHVVHFGLREWESTSYGAALLPVLISSQGRDLLSFIESALEYVLLLLVLFLPTDIIIRLWARSSQKVKKVSHVPSKRLPRKRLTVRGVGHHVPGGLRRSHVRAGVLLPMRFRHQSHGSQICLSYNSLHHLGCLASGRHLRPLIPTWMKEGPGALENGPTLDRQ